MDSRMAGPFNVDVIEAAFEAALTFTLRCEGVQLAKGDTGYVNDPADPGGATNYGITQGVFDAYRQRIGGAASPVREIRLEEVRVICREEYWDPAGCNAFAVERPRLALAHFDAAVNMGVTQAVKCLQRAVGAEADGIVGARTIAAVKARDEAAAIEAYLADRRRVYCLIAERRPASVKFLRGWLARCERLGWATLEDEMPGEEDEDRDTDISLITDFMLCEMPPHELVAVEDILEADVEFRNKVAPIIKMYNAPIRVSDRFNNEANPEGPPAGSRTERRRPSHKPPLPS